MTYFIDAGVAVCVHYVQSLCLPSLWAPQAEYNEDKKEYYRVCKGLSSIPGSINAEALGVYLYGNSITRVRANSFSQLSHCTVLDLKFNDIEQIEMAAFNGLDSLKKLILNDNKLRVIQTGVFSKLISLERLQLSDNNIERIEMGALNGLVSLNDLDVTSNGLRVIESGTFSQLQALKRLQFTVNKITRIHAGAFSKLISLEYLGLAYNELRVIEPGTFSQLPALGELMLTGNKLTTLPWTIFRDTAGNINHPAHLVLYLSENPIRCDTALCWMKQSEQDGWLELWTSNNRPICSDYAGASGEVCSLQGK